jgi:hypothetical protein
MRVSKKPFVVAVVFLSTLTLALVATSCVPRAQQSDASAMQKLQFLAGSWVCTVKGGRGNGLVLNLDYSFSPDGLWMTEHSEDAETKGGDWATQIWGYDAFSNKLVAYQFVSSGLFTKTVDGWVNGIFTSHRNDNGATVSLKPIDAKSFQWIIESADHSSIVRQDCVKS